LILAISHSVIYQTNQFFAHHKIREALAKVNGLVLYRQCTHGGKDGGADIGEFALE
jgi:hypothetical protein